MEWTPPATTANLLCPLSPLCPLPSTRVALSSNRSSFTSTRGYDAAGREGGGGTTDRSLGLDLLGLESVFQTGHGTRYFVEDQR